MKNTEMIAALLDEGSRCVGSAMALVVEEAEKGVLVSPFDAIAASHGAGIELGIRLALVDVDVARALLRDVDDRYGDELGENIAECNDAIQRFRAAFIRQTGWTDPKG